MSECPVDSFKDAYPFLRRPFTPAAIKFKVQAQWPKTNPTGALIVPYIDARLAAGRLNAVIPDKWSTQFKPDGEGNLICHLTVDGVTRSDIGSDYKGKGLWSDALKRAAVHFGVGESLYVLPKMILNVGQQLKVNNQGKVEITPAGDKHCRSVYSMWLEDIGTKAFGEPLDHGDVLYEEVEEPAVEVNEPAPELSPMDTLKALIAQEGLDGDEVEALKKWLKPSDDINADNVDTAIEYLEAGDKGSLMAAMEFGAVPA